MRIFPLFLGMAGLALVAACDDSGGDGEETECPECESCGTDDDGDGYTTEQGDCDDTDAAINPAAEEVCGDGVDRDCSGDTDDGALDADDDGHISTTCTGGTDCDDDDDQVNPDAIDICDDLDNDCDELVDEDVIVVDPNGSGDSTSIQDAIDSASDGDAICVLEGTYYENVLLSATNLALTALSGPEVTIIDGGGVGSALEFAYGDTSAVQGFTITNGIGSLFDPDNDGALDACGGGVFVDASTPTMIDVIVTGNQADDGGGIYVNNASLDISDSVVTGNQAVGYGGGVRLRHSEDVVLDGVVVSDNSARTGGGLSFYDSDGSLIDCEVAGNAADNNGGGLYIGSESDLELAGGTVEGNSAVALGGGVRVYQADAIITGATISGNSATDGGGGVACKKGTLSATGADITGNDPDDVYCDECEGCTDAR